MEEAIDLSAMISQLSFGSWAPTSEQIVAQSTVSIMDSPNEWSDSISGVTSAGLVEHNISQGTTAIGTSAGAHTADNPFTVDSPHATIVIETSDGVTFIVSRELLSKDSTFFADLLSIPSSAENHIRDAVLPLPSATSGGLSLVLSVLQSLETPPADCASCAGEMLDDEAPDWLHIGVEDLEQVGQAMRLADAYDIPTFATAFVDGIRSAMHGTVAMLGFTLLALVHAKGPVIAELAKQTLTSPRTVKGTITALSHSIPAAYRGPLQRFAPEYLDRLQDLHYRHAVAAGELYVAMAVKEPIFNEFDEYAVRCRGDKKGYKHCPAYGMQPKWAMLRANTATTVYRRAMADPKFADLLTLRQLVASQVPCQKCATRLYNTFLICVARFAEARGGFWT